MIKRLFFIMFIIALVYVFLILPKGNSANIKTPKIITIENRAQNNNTFSDVKIKTYSKINYGLRYFKSIFKKGINQVNYKFNDIFYKIKEQLQEYNLKEKIQTNLNKSTEEISNFIKQNTGR